MAKYKVLTDKLNTFFTNNKITLGTAAPTTGTHTAGDVVISSSANATAFGWICITSGTPGKWKVLKSGADVTSIAWGNVSGKPSTYAPTLGTTSTTAFRGDYGNVAYNHSKQAHAPSNAQKNSDITKAEIEAKLTGNIGTHTHNYLPLSGGYLTGSIYLPNNMSVYGKNKDGINWNLMGVDSSNRIYVGWGNEAQVHHNNETIFNRGVRFTGMITHTAPSSRTLAIEHYTNPDRLEFFWSNTNGGTDWVWNGRTYIDADGVIYASKQFNLAGQIFKPYSGAGLSIINADGSQFSGLEIKELWLGPYSGATRRLTMSASAPANPSYGEVWIQNN